MPTTPTPAKAVARNAVAMRRVCTCGCHTRNTAKSDTNNPGPTPLDVIDEIIERDFAKGTFKHIESHIDNAIDNAALYDPDGNLATVNDSMRNASLLLARVMSKVVAEGAAGYQRKQPGGRLNVRRWIQYHDPVTAFDRWRPDVRDASSMEIVTLVDVSTSMDGTTDQLAGMAWAIKHGAERIVGPRVTVILYSDSFEYLYRGEEKARPQYAKRVEVLGGTDPRRALQEAASIFQKTDKRFKALFTLTDGDWWRQDISAAYSREHMSDVSSHLIGVGSYVPSSDPWKTHGHRYSKALSLSAFPRYFEQVVVRDIQEHIGR